MLPRILGSITHSKKDRETDTVRQTEIKTERKRDRQRQLETARQREQES